jgi:ribonuclease R
LTNPKTKIAKGHHRKLVDLDQQPKLGKGLIAAEIVDVDDDGSLIAVPIDWLSDQQPPRFRIIERRRSPREGALALGLASRVVVRALKKSGDEWSVSVVRRLVQEVKKHLGIFQPHRRGGTISSLSRRDPFPGVSLNREEAKGLEAGDVVQYTLDSHQHFHVIKVLGKFDDPHMFSEIAIQNQGLPAEFSPEALTIASQGKVPPLGERTDFRSLPLVTIDGEDARDFDDAVWATSDSDPRNPGGWRALVAIADVAYYVRPGRTLDAEAKDRGNSVYFPDRVVPMLPEALSNDLCSLRPQEDRACLAIEMIISAHGKLKSFRVKRGLMRSQARLTYTQVQQALDGHPDKTTAPLLDAVIQPLYGVYQSLLAARNQRGTLDLDVPERQVIFDRQGRVLDIKIRQRFDSHRIIEELMISANVCAAKTLIAKNWPCLFRVHDKPDLLKVANLRQFLKQYKLSLPKSTDPTPAQYNAVLQEAGGRPYSRTISELVLRSMAQAQYSPTNLGHFGLSLAHYAHFTSPIRRYADLVIHRSLITALNLGEGGYESQAIDLDGIGQHVSETERRAAAAEREVMDRFKISFVAAAVGQEVDGVIVGVNRYGLFIELEKSGAEGFVPLRFLEGDYFSFEEATHCLVGRHTKIVYQLGQKVRVILVDADDQTNSLTLRLVSKTVFSGKGKRKKRPIFVSE